MAIYKVLSEKLYTVFSLLRMGLFGAALGFEGKEVPLPRIVLISYNDDIWYSYRLPKEDLKI